MGEVVRFIKANPERKADFDAMVEEISVITHIHPSTIEKMGVRALKGWKDRSHQDLYHFIEMPKTQRISNITRMLEYLRNYLQPLILQDENLEKAIRAASLHINKLFL